MDETMYEMPAWTEKTMSETPHKTNPAAKSILISSDIPDLPSTRADLLQAEGYQVEIIAERSLDSRSLERYRPDLLMIDVTSASLEMISLCHELRHGYAGPIMFCSAQASEMLQILALEMGIDDFFIGPLSGAFALAKVRALLRRSQELQNQNYRKVFLGDLTIDAERREVLAGEEVIELTTREFDVLWCLAQNTRKVLSRDDIHRQLYNSEYNGFDRSIDIYISRIRQKIGDDPNHPRYLKTVRGTGYLLADERPA